VLMPEYPGYGTAGGHPTQESITNAALGAYDWLHMQPDIDTARILAYRTLTGRRRRHTPGHAQACGGACARVLVYKPAHLRGSVLCSRFPGPRSIRQSGRAEAVQRSLLVLHGRQDQSPHSLTVSARGRCFWCRVHSMACGHNDWRSALASGSPASCSGTNSLTACRITRGWSCQRARRTNAGRHRSAAPALSSGHAALA